MWAAATFTVSSVCAVECSATLALVVLPATTLTDIDSARYPMCLTSMAWVPGCIAPRNTPEESVTPNATPSTRTFACCTACPLVALVTEIRRAPVFCAHAGRAPAPVKRPQIRTEAPNDQREPA